VSLLDIAMSLASNQSDKLARFLGKSPAQVKAAMEEGKKLLPEIMANPTAEGGAQILNRIGVDKKFLEGALTKYGKFGSTVGLSGSTIRNAVANLSNALDRKKQKALPPGKSSFNRAKYTKV
jgi:hypothetical protein